MIDSVIFDMDGLMFDTERVWATLWEPALATLGLSYKEGLDVAARGTAGDTMRAVLRRFYGENCDTDAIIEALHAQAERHAAVDHSLPVQHVLKITLGHVDVREHLQIRPPADGRAGLFAVGRGALEPADLSLIHI